VVEERIISGVLFNALIGTVLAGWIGSVVGAMLVAMVIAGSSGLAKLAFDSLVQRDAPDANHGRSFARFEGRFQLFWVLGAFLPVALPMPIEVGYITMVAGIGVGLVGYLTSTRQARRMQRQATPEEPDRPDGQLGFWPLGADQAGENSEPDEGV
jgi:membrane associated rhomboid family serine protease